MIGTFYLPDEVLIDSYFLSSLPMKQKINGIVEIIKASLIDSPSLFKAMHSDIQKWEKQDPDFIMDCIYESVLIKQKIIEQDPGEKKGIRRTLNLGHTFGHALETLEEYQIEHGEAIAIGILISCFISNKMGLLSKEEFKKIYELFLLYQVPLKITQEHTFEDLLAALVRDKKARNTTPRFVLLENIGKISPFDGEYCTEVEFSLLEEAIVWMHKQFFKNNARNIDSSS